MSYRFIQILTAEDYSEQLDVLEEKGAILDYWEGKLKERKRNYTLLCRTEDSQEINDMLAPMAAKEDGPHIIILPVQAALPQPKEDEEEKAKAIKEMENGKKQRDTISREELYEGLRVGSKLDSNYMMLVLFSALVAAVGVLQNNVAVIIGAMVIAPLLGPNLALALGATLGDRELLVRAAKTGIVGLLFAVVIGVFFGAVWNGEIYSEELIARTDIGLDGVLIAIVSGAAGVLSLTTGVSSVLVGVMVAVALMPPAVVLGIMLGHTDFDHALGAGLLLAINVVCINLSAKAVFRLKGVEPRTWYHKQKVKGRFKWQLLSWTVALILLIGAAYLHRYFGI